MQGSLTPAITAFLPPWVAQQRWYAGKGRVPVLRRIGGLRLDDPAAEVVIDVHLLLDESGKTPTTYQVPLTYRGAPLAGAADALEPHRVASYLLETAQLVHTWYHKHHVLGEPPAIMHARLFLAQASRIVLRNGLAVLGIAAPDRM